MRIYDATNGRQLPELPRCGVVYEFHHRNKDGSEGHGLYSPTGDRKIEPSIERIAYAASRLLDDPDDPCHLLVLDDESRPILNIWSNLAYLTEKRLEENRDHHIRLMQNARIAMPGHRIGMYGLGAPSYSTREGDGSRDDEVEQFSSRLGYDRKEDGTFSPVGLIEHLDFISPAVYVRPGEDFSKWKRRVDKMIRFCRRWHRQIVLFHNPAIAAAHTKAVPWFKDSLAYIGTHPGVDVALWSANKLSDEHKQVILGSYTPTRPGSLETDE